MAKKRVSKFNVYNHKRLFLIVILFAILFLFMIKNISSAENIQEKTEQNVHDILKENKEIPVIIELKDTQEILQPRGMRLSSLSAENIKVNKNEVKMISKEDLKNLEDNENIKKISYAPQIRAILSTAVPLINATAVWPLRLNSINITGTDETVCVIDSGIDFTHPDLIGKNMTTCVIDCFEKTCVENCTMTQDDNGHGTHVAGIVAANGAVKGVGINIGLIGVKVLDSNGDGSSTNAEADLKNAIDWCVENRLTYNISVISMSLGTITLYTNICDSTFTSSWTKAINNATHYNISVVSATGNDASSTGINAPACIVNSSAVGGTDDNDEFYVNTNKNSLTDFFAPGVDILSTYLGHGYATASGTSMSTPHVSGAMALIRQFYRLQSNRVLTPLEIKLALNHTSVFKTVGSKQVPRIDVYSAIISLDGNAPDVSLISPVNNHINSTTNQTFICNATDAVQMKNLTLQIWNYNNELYYNFTNSSSSNSGTFISIEKTKDLIFGDYHWNCLAYDMNNNESYASSNFSLSLGNLSVSLNSPSNNTYTNINQTNFTCLSQTASLYDLNNVTFYLWNSTGGLINNSNQIISSTSNSTTFEYNFTAEDIYSWNCLAYNNESEGAFASSNNTLTFDITSPNISSVSASPSTTSATIIWTTNEDSNSSVNYGTSASLGSNTNSSEFLTSHSISLSGLTASTSYYYNITSCDRAGNCRINGTQSFTTSAEQVINTGGSSGGGGGASTGVKTYIPSQEQIVYGYTKELNINDIISFDIIINKVERHTIRPVEVYSNYAVIEIRSEPFNTTLKINEEKKFDLAGDGFYDLKIKLNGIVGSKVNLTINSIYEKIQEPEKEPIQIEAKDENLNETPNKNKIASLFSLIKLPLGIFIAIIIFILIILYAKKGDKKHIEEYKDKFNKHVKPRKK